MGRQKKEIAERYRIREKFWTQLLELAKAKTKLHGNISPTQHNWLGASAGKQGLGYNYVLRKYEAQVEFYIDRGKDKEEENKKIFEILFKKKEGIEKVFNDTLTWEALEGKRACRIKKIIGAGGYRDEEKEWPVIHDSMIDAMIRLEESLRPHVQKLQI